MSTMTFQPMIEAAEVWAASADSAELRRCASISDIDQHVVELVMERMRSELGPVMIDRDDPASANGAPHHGSAVFGIPIVVEREMKAGLVLSITCLENSMGAIEIWSRDQRDELGLNGAVFASLGRFASISHHVRFPRGSGLPGQSWEDREAKIITGLGTSRNFMRAAGARAGGLDVGVALPIMTGEFELNSVILMLSSKSTPIARMFEIWDVDAAEHVMRLRVDAHTNCAVTGSEEEVTTYAPGEGIVGKVWLSGVPLVSDDLPSKEEKRLACFSANGLTTAIAIPLYVGESLKSVFVMLN